MYKLREVESANAIRQQCRVEREKQIDSIVAKVDAETMKIQQDFEAKIRYITFTEKFSRFSSKSAKFN